MAKRAPYTLALRGKVWHLRCSHAGRRYSVATGESDRAAARSWAARWHADLLAGRLAVPSPPGATSAAPLLELAARWLASLAATHDAATIATYEGYARRWVRRWSRLGEVTTAAAAQLARDRLLEVTRGSVRKELSALRGLLLWAHEELLLPELPAPPRLPPRAVGTRASHRPERATPLTPEQVAAVLAALPVWSSERPDRYAVRAYFVFAAETGLRPATILGLSAPEHWASGRTSLQVPARLDKNRLGREVPLSPLALGVLEELVPQGLIFGPAKRRSSWLREAARAAGLPPELAAQIVPYDLRHARATSLLAAGASLPGVQHLLGHTQIGTTGRYLHPTAEHARAALVLAGGAAGSGARTGARGEWGWSCRGRLSPTPPPISPVFLACGARGGT